MNRIKNELYKKWTYKKWNYKKWAYKKRTYKKRTYKKRTDPSTPPPLACACSQPQHDTLCSVREDEYAFAI